MPKDDKCVVCGAELTAMCISHKDPFCSTDCCKKYFGVIGSSSTISTTKDVQQAETKRGISTDG